MADFIANGESSNSISYKLGEFRNMLDTDVFNSENLKASISKTIITSWIGSVAPFTQTISVIGMLDTYRPIISPIYSLDNPTAIIEKVNWGYIDKYDVNIDSITFTCFEKKPTIDINIQIKGI